MPRTIERNFSRHCGLFLYAFTPTHIKEVMVGLLTTYESKTSGFSRRKEAPHYFCFFLAPKIITIKSYPIALTCRFIQFLILIYAVGYIMWYKRGYQDRDSSLTSSVTMHVRGIGSHGNESQVHLDNADYIVPSQENNALFIMTNFISTDQKRTVCGEGAAVEDANCTVDAQCRMKRKYPARSNGRWTGRCSQAENRCQIEGWCPVEDDRQNPFPIVDSLNYTIALNNFIEFTRFGIKRTNILSDSDYFRQCLYHPKEHRLCPIFRLGDLIEFVEENKTERFEMLKHGCVMRLKIDWMCNIDLGVDECKPEYSLGRLDSKFTEEQFSIGFNFRYASHWKMNNESHRTLMKAFGLRLIVTVNGEAGRLDLFVLTLNIGSMIGVLGLATVICDLLALYFSSQSQLYRREKYQSVSLRKFSVNSSERQLTRMSEPLNRRS